MTGKEIDQQIAILQAEKRKIKKDEEISQYGEWSKIILDNINEEILLQYEFIPGLPKTLFCHLSWRDAPYNCPEIFAYQGLVYRYQGTDGGCYVHYYGIEKEDGELFTLEELVEIIPNFKELLEDRLENIESRRENLKKILEKITRDAK